MKTESSFDNPSCERFQAELKTWLDHELPAARVVPLEAHLKGCGRCRLVAEQFRDLTAQLRKALDVPPLRSARSLAAGAAELSRSLDREEAQSVRSLKRVSMAAAALLCASLVFALSSNRLSLPGPTTTASVSQADGLDDVLDLAINDSSWGDDL